MEYRRLGRTDLQVSAVSLGTEYLIDLPREHVVEVIHAALDHGINYFDLFFAQPEFRDNMGAAFKGHRDQALLTAHLGAVVQDGQYARSRDLKLSEEYLNDFLRRYETDHVDVLMIHNCDEQEDLDKILAFDGMLDLAQKLQSQGKARYIGFSGHTAATAQQAVETEYIDVVMYPINLAGHAVPGREAFLSACAIMDVGVVGMKPYAGGRLLEGMYSIRVEKFQSGGEDREIFTGRNLTPVQCLSYALSQVGISTVVPGCKDVAQLEAALAYLDADAVARDYADIVSEFGQYVAGECVFCNHCLPCPANIDIGRVMRLLESARRTVGLEVYNEYQGLSASGADCIQCGDCMSRCPFDVDVISKMKEAEHFMR